MTCQNIAFSMLLQCIVTSQMGWKFLSLSVLYQIHVTIVLRMVFVLLEKQVRSGERNIPLDLSTRVIALFIKLNVQWQFLKKNLANISPPTCTNVHDQYVNNVHYICLITLIYKHKNLIKAAMILVVERNCKKFTPMKSCTTLKPPGFYMVVGSFTSCD